MPSFIYIYDDLGRLAAVVDPAGGTGTYAYDAVGNLLSIEHKSSSVVSIIDFTPKGASAGTSVTVHGSSFSELPGENAVTFNGIPATVISATATQIVTTVPPGAVSGPITVTTPTGSATSTASFTVTAAPQEPVIASFSPAIGVPSTAVTINGTHFDTTLANNKAVFNRVLAILNSSTATTLETEVPLRTGSGRITVSTPYGKTVSSEDFFIPPGSRTEADVEFTGRISHGDSIAVTIGTPNKIALVLFDGTAGQRINLGITEASFGGGVGLGEVSILRPDGATLAKKLVGDGGDSIDAEALHDTGTYTIMVDPGAYTASLTLTVSEPVTGTIAIDGSPVPLIIDKPGQKARLTFDGTAGQLLNLGVSEVSFGTGAGLAIATVSILGSDGAAFASDLVTNNGLGIHTGPLPQTGTYMIVVDPEDAKTVSLVLTLSEPFTGVLTIGGPSVPLDLRPGQEAQLTFDGTAGQRLNLGVTEVGFGTGDHALISILKPDGTTLISTTTGTSGNDLDADFLPDTGTYTIVVDPEWSSWSHGATTATLTLILSEPVSGVITIGGSAVPLILSRPGQKARLTFDGTAGQRLNLGESDVTISDIQGSFAGGEVSILRLDGTALASMSISTEGDGIDTGPLPDTGTYTIVVEPPGIRTVSLTLTLSFVP